MSKQMQVSRQAYKWGGRTTVFDRAICALIRRTPRHDCTGARDGRWELMVAALDHRVPYSTIRNWRRGHRAQAPAWAVETVRRKLVPSAEAVADLDLGADLNRDQRAAPTWRPT